MKNKYAAIVLCISLLYVLFVQFYHLGKLPIVQWDESRLAVNAAEMSVSKDYLITSFGYSPDLYNTKPPLMIWLQVLSVNCFGLNEMAIRIPSALAGLCTILLVGLFVFKITKNIYSSCLAMLILTTCDGFIQLHGSLTGDYDALLSFFLMVAVCLFYLFLETNTMMYFYTFIFFVALAVMTKSAAALIFFPVYFALAYYYSKFKYFKRLSVGLLIALVPFLIFCLLRENANSGYLYATWNNDFGGRFLNGKDGHEGHWSYYVTHLFTYRFSLFIWLIPPAILWGIYKHNRAINFMSIIIILYLIFISIAKTKLEWYDIPLFPVLSISVVFFVIELAKHLEFVPFKIGVYAIILMCLFWSMFQKFNYSYSGENRRLSMDVYAISESIRLHKGPEKLNYYSRGYDAWNYFYTINNPTLKRIDYDCIETGQKIVIENMLSDSIKLKFNFKTIDSNKYAKTIQITGSK